MDAPVVGIAGQPSVDPGARFRRRGRILFKVLAFMWVILGGAVITLGGSDRPALPILVAAICLVLSVAVASVLVKALAEGRPWADRATVFVCSILLAVGVIRALARSSGGTLEIPLDAIGAVLVLAVRPATFAKDRPGDGRRIGFVAAAALLAACWPLFGDAVASGRILGAGPDDVSVQVTVDCTAIAADPAAPIVVHASWAWSGGELLSGGTDGFVVRWAASTDTDPPDPDPESLSGLDVEGAVEISPADAVWHGSGGPAAALTDPIEAQGYARTFGITVGQYGLVDGRAVLRLRPVSPNARHGSVQVRASYAHLDRWLQESGFVGCTW